MEAQSNMGISNKNDQLFPDEQATSSLVETEQKGRPAKKGLVVRWLIVFFLIACLGPAIGFFTFIGANQDEWLALGDEFMQAMADKEIDRAYARFAEETQREFSRSDLAAFIDGPFFAFFEDYVDLEMDGWYINYDTLTGLAVRVTGLVNYQDGSPGRFEMFLAKEGETWKLLTFNVEEPPEKINAYSAVQP